MGLRHPTNLEKIFIGISVLEILIFIMNICGAAELKKALDSIGIESSLRMTWYDRMAIALAMYVHFQLFREILPFNI